MWLDIGLYWSRNRIVIIFYLLNVGKYSTRNIGDSSGLTKLDCPFLLSVTVAIAISRLFLIVPWQTSAANYIDAAMWSCMFNIVLANGCTRVLLSKKQKRFFSSQLTPLHEKGSSMGRECTMYYRHIYMLSSSYSYLVNFAIQPCIRHVLVN